MRQMAGRIEFTVFQRSHRLPRETGRSRKSLDTRAFRHSYAIDGRIKDCVLIDFACGTGGFITSWLGQLQKQVKNTDAQRQLDDSNVPVSALCYKHAPA